MVKNIIRDIMFLSKKSELATKDDLDIARDLLDTLSYNKDKCVGMAANMIGKNKSIIVVSNGLFNFIMINPIIVKKFGEYKTEEGCLSLEGQRTCTRYKEIEVDYFDMDFNKKHGKFTDFVAEIIQHEIDHLNGIII